MLPRRIVVWVRLHESGSTVLISPRLWKDCLNSMLPT